MDLLRLNQRQVGQRIQAVVKKMGMHRGLYRLQFSLAYQELVFQCRPLHGIVLLRHQINIMSQDPEAIQNGTYDAQACPGTLVIQQPVSRVNLIQ